MDVDDFDGDEQAMMKYKLDHGIRLLNQREKFTLFGLFDDEM